MSLLAQFMENVSSVNSRLSAWRCFAQVRRSFVM